MGNSEKIQEYLAPKLAELNCFLVEIRANPSSNHFEVFIDSDEGITIQACEQVSRYLGFQLDKDTDFPQSYSLDVSSPGMDNPFRVKRQYVKNAGKTVEVLLANGVKKEGILMGLDGDAIKLQVMDPPVKKKAPAETKVEAYPLTEIKYTKLKFEFGQKKK